jgi:hypothetical protein
MKRRPYRYAFFRPELGGFSDFAACPRIRIMLKYTLARWVDETTRELRVKA